MRKTVIFAKTVLSPINRFLTTIIRGPRLAPNQFQSYPKSERTSSWSFVLFAIQASLPIEHFPLALRPDTIFFCQSQMCISTVRRLHC